MNIIEINNVSFTYNDHPVLQNINLNIKEKDFLAVLGPNGGGKTTLLKLILGLLKPTKGTIKVLGRSPIKAHSHIGYVPQFGEFDLDFPIKVKEVVMMSNLNPKSILPWYKKETEKKAMDILHKLQIADLSNKLLNELSGGQKQRTLIARALMTDPKILLLDEPTASVDNTMEKDVFEILKKLNNQKTIIVVSHDVGFISSYVNKVSCLNQCICTHKIDNLDNKTVLDVYNGSMKILHHRCKI